MYAFLSSTRQINPFCIAYCTSILNRQTSARWNASPLKILTSDSSPSFRKLYHVEHHELRERVYDGPAAPRQPPVPVCPGVGHVQGMRHRQEGAVPPEVSPQLAARVRRPRSELGDFEIEERGEDASRVDEDLVPPKSVQRVHAALAGAFVGVGVALVPGRRRHLQRHMLRVPHPPKRFRAYEFRIPVVVGRIALGRQEGARGDRHQEVRVEGIRYGDAFPEPL
mmetsp:Transcript_26557/g.56493  ORF Transcript_26557/g.56493 Transcript_26557/m.56493 type:complete len:224 (-) Transcript_26557:117-788(-)